jgi:hypothetical protein
MINEEKGKFSLRSSSCDCFFVSCFGCCFGVGLIWIAATCTYPLHPPHPYPPSHHKPSTHPTPITSLHVGRYDGARFLQRCWFVRHCFRGVSLRWVQESRQRLGGLRQLPSGSERVDGGGEVMRRWMLVGGRMEIEFWDYPDVHYPKTDSCREARTLLDW